MSPTDPRHGTVAGYRAGCRLQCCKDGINRYHQARKLRKLRNQPPTSLEAAQGTQRRLQALMALGWSLTRVAEHADIHPTYLRVIVRGRTDRVAASTANKTAAAYAALCMSLPSQDTPREQQSVTRTLRLATKLGYQPPLAWDDIDRDPEPPAPAAEPEVDWVVVERILAGDVVPATPAERRAVVACWPGTGRPLNDLARLTGWKVERYHAHDGAAA